MPTDTRFAESNCRLCGTAACPVVLRRPEYRVRRCPECTTMWCDPLRFEQTWRDDVEGTAVAEDAYLSVDDTIHGENAGRLALLREVAPARTHARLVEIGCMHGDFVAQARSVGYDALGLDLSESAVEWAERNRPGLVRFGTLGEEQEDASADVIAAFNVVEHMEEPGQFLDHVHRVLRPGGVLVAETPAQESIYHHVMFARGRLQSRRPDIDIGMYPGTHIFKFGKRAWTNILERRGFEMMDMRSKSTPLRELLAKNRQRSFVFRASIVGFGVAARLTGLGNRVLLAARRP